MKQSGCIWNKTLNDQMLAWGFTRLACESCMYHHTTPTGIPVAAMHINDFLYIANSSAENERFKKEMREIWTISDLGTVCFVIGIAVRWYRPHQTVHLSQSALIDKVVHLFRQANADPLPIPMAPG